MPPSTNVFALGELKTLSWTVYQATNVSESELLSLRQRLEPQLLCLASDEGDRQLWVFTLNNSNLRQRSLPSDLANAEVSKGEWSQESQNTLDPHVQKHLLSAVHGFLSSVLVSSGEFIYTNGYFYPNDPAIVFLYPSLLHSNHFDINLKEQTPRPSFQLHPQLFHSHVCVNVDVTLQIPHTPVSLESAWQQKMGLPTALDHSVVDVWHSKASLPARITSETDYKDAFPRFRAVTRRRKRRKKADDSSVQSGSEGAGLTNELKGVMEEVEEDEEEAAVEAEVESVALGQAPPVVPPTPSAPQSAALTSEFTKPVSPDPLANQPNANTLVMRMTFPKDPVLDPVKDLEVHAYKRRLKDRSVLKPSDDFKPVELSPQLGKKTEESISPTDKMSISRMIQTKYLSSINSKNSGVGDDEVHPVLQTLAEQVEVETQEWLKRSEEALTFETTVANADSFMPSPRAIQSFSTLSSFDPEEYHMKQASKSLAPWRVTYSATYYDRSRKRQRKKEKARKLLLSFRFSQLDQYQSPSSLMDTIQKSEISIGVRVAAIFSRAGWDQSPSEHLLWWSRQSTDKVVAASTRYQKSVVQRLEPVLSSAVTRLQPESNEEGETHAPWLSFDDFTTKVFMKKAQLPVVPLKPPRFVLSSEEVTFHAEPQAVAEYVLRGLHPVSAQKPLDYAILCPVSPSDWLATLTLSYLTSFRSMYSRCNMGDHAPLDLSSLTKQSGVQIDSSNSMLLLECPTKPEDAFQNYRLAAQLLNPMMQDGTRKQQAFSRSAVSNVLYVVAPFGKRDMKHKMWLLGALAKGLFGAEDVEQVAWRHSMTLELLYLEDIYEGAFHMNPSTLSTSCFALYDRVMERVELSPLAGAKPTDTETFVGERLYHLTDRRTSPSPPCFIYAAYSIPSNGKWLHVSCTDAIGSLLETHSLPIDESDKRKTYISMMHTCLRFIALLGDPAVLVITRLGQTDGRIPEEEVEVWASLYADRKEELIPEAYANLVSKMYISHASTVSTEKCQLRGEENESILCADESQGVLALSPLDVRPSRTTLLSSHDAWQTDKLSYAKQLHRKEPVMLHVEIVKKMPEHVEETVEEEGAVTATSGVMQTVLEDFHALSYLTMNPATLERQSPYPLHLAAVDKMKREVDALESQLTSDPLQLRSASLT